TAISDGAGLAAKLQLLQTPRRIATTLRAGFKPTAAKRRLVGAPLSIHAGLVNGDPAIVAVSANRVVGVVVLEVRDGDKVAAVCGMAAAHRLGRLTAQWQRTEHPDPVLENW